MIKKVIFIAISAYCIFGIKESKSDFRDCPGGGCWCSSPSYEGGPWQCTTTGWPYDNYFKNYDTGDAGKAECLEYCSNSIPQAKKKKQ